MKRKPILICLLLITLHFVSHSQDRCGFDELHAKRMKADPQYMRKVVELEKNIQDYIRKNKKRLSAREMGITATLYTIPVVVHVMHTGAGVGTTYNPADAQIQGAIDYLNQVYNGTYPGTQGVGDIQIQFALAVRDPYCNPTNGIERVDASGLSNYTSNGVNASTTGGVDELSLKNLSRWNPREYYNIWVVNKIDGNDGTSGTFIAGFAYFPGVSYSYDGTVMLATQMQSGRKTLPHEIGHAFGVYHPFEGGNATTCPVDTSCSINGDRVCDTDPITLPSGFTCRTGTNTCTGTAYSDNTESNYMNYTSCYNLFTSGQKDRMLAFAASVYRYGLSVSSALTSTNIVYPYSNPVAASCIPTTNSSYGMTGNYAGILGVQVSSKEYYSLTPPYDGNNLDETSQCIKLVQLTKGGSYDFAALTQTVNGHQLRAWIDYNNDGSFDNSTEQIHYNSSFGSAQNYLTSGTFVVPNTATTNTVLRLRVLEDLSTSYGVPAITSACINPVYGQAEDYPVYIQDAIILPVTLINFTGKLLDNKILLNWSTVSEQNTKTFDIEKSSDGFSYYAIGRLSASGNNNEARNYSFEDFDVEETNFYRIKMNDGNGHFTYSSIVSIENKTSQQGISFIKNPFANGVSLQLKKAANQITLQLINTNGTMLAQKSFSNAREINWPLPTQLSNGMYILKTIADGRVYVNKLIKE